MLLSGYIQPIPDLSPVIPSMDEIPSVDPEISPYETNIISFYKTWDTFGAFSNFSPHPIHMPDENGDSFMWPTVEHYYQVCLLFFVAMCVCVRARPYQVCCGKEFLTKMNTIFFIMVLCHCLDCL